MTYRVLLTDLETFSTRALCAFQTYKEANDFRVKMEKQIKDKIKATNEKLVQKYSKKLNQSII